MLELNPAPEYCFLFVQWWPFCMTKAEWSGWMQAVGSVAAIGVAIWIPWNAQREQTRQARKQALAFAGQAVQSLGAAYQACKVVDATLASSQRAILESSLAIGMGVPLHLLASDVMSMVLTLRALLLDTLNRTQAMGHLDGPSWIEAAVEFGVAENNAWAILERVGLRRPTSTDVAEQ